MQRMDGEKVGVLIISSSVKRRRRIAAKKKENEIREDGFPNGIICVAGLSVEERKIENGSNHV